MGKYITKKITLFAVLILFITSCGRKHIQTVTTIKEKDSISHELQSKSNTNKAIAEAIYIPVPIIKTIKPDCDSIAQAELERALERMNYEKVSGDNRFKLLYNKYNKLLTVQANIAETKSDTIIINDTKVKYVTKEVEREIPVRYTPWYILYPAYFGFFCAFLIICWIIKKIYSLWLPKLPIS